MEAWPRLEPDEEIKVGWRTLVRKTFEQPDGRPAEYVTKDAIGKVAVAIVALTQDNQVIIAEQFRPGPERVLQELPGGGAEEGEDYQAAVLRELHEETGYVSDDVSYLGKVYKDAYTNTSWHYYLAKNSHQAHDQKLDDGEFVNVKLISIDQLFENARSAKMTDTEAVFLAYDELKSLMQRR
ncbi:ADP-ribose pyrophosphatase [compost metagenome]